MFSMHAMDKVGKYNGFGEGKWIGALFVLQNGMLPVNYIITRSL